MKIAAITRYQAGQLRELLDQAGWSQRELSAQTGISTHIIGSILNLRRRMKKCERRSFRRAFKKIGIEAPLVDDWPKDWKGLTREQAKVTQIEEVPLDHLIGYQDVKELPAPEENKREKLMAFIEELAKGQNPAWLEMFWLREVEGWTYKRIGEHFGGITIERVKQVINTLIRRIHKKVKRMEHISPRPKGKRWSKKYAIYPEDQEPIPPTFHGKAYEAHCARQAQEVTGYESQPEEEPPEEFDIEAEEWFRAETWLNNIGGGPNLSQHKRGATIMKRDGGLEIIHPLDPPPASKATVEMEGDSQAPPSNQSPSSS